MDADKKEESPDIFELIKANDVEELKSLPKSFVSDSCFKRLDGSRTPLLLACELNYTDLAKYLIENTEFLDSSIPEDGNITEGVEGWTAMHFACYHQNLELVCQLLLHGASVFPEVQGIWMTEETPLIVSARTGNHEILKSLLDEAEKDTEDAVNNTLDGFYIKTPIFEAVSHSHAQATELLLSRGADVNKRGMRCCIPLHYAAAAQSTKDNRSIIDLVLAKTNDVDVQGEDRNTPLHLAAESNNIYAIKQLAKRGAKLEQNDEYYNPLEITIIQNSTRTLRVLLKEFESKITDSMLTELIYTACESGNVESLNIVFRNKPGFLDNILKDIKLSSDIMYAAAKSGSADIVRALIKRGFFVKLDAEWKPLDDQIVCLLIESGSLSVIDYFQSWYPNEEYWHCNEMEGIVDYYYRRGFQSSLHTCREASSEDNTDTEQEPCVFIGRHPGVLSLQRLSSNSIREAITAAQNQNYQNGKACIPLYNAVKALAIPIYLQNYLVDLDLDNDDDLTEFDVFPVTDSEHSDDNWSTSDQSETSDSDSQK